MTLPRSSLSLAILVEKFLRFEKTSRRLPVQIASALAIVGSANARFAQSRGLAQMHGREIWCVHAGLAYFTHLQAVKFVRRGAFREKDTRSSLRGAR